MVENMSWKLSSPPETPVVVAGEVVSLQVPLVKAIRDGLGGWTFTGPEGSEVSETAAMETTLGAVSVVWPHVSGLIRVAPGQTAVWVWSRHGWATVGSCDCGE